MSATRRLILQGAAALGLAGPAAATETVTLPFGNGERPLERYPQKR
ncbi:MAG: hypothetical protein JO111_08930, partial [Caulobacteraceae bacterium]|nr:hypothetical protein [Caulobacteraceae bacterium]